MTPVFRTARLRRVAVLTVLGLAFASAVLGGCIWLHNLAQSTRASEVAVYRLASNVERTYSLPRTVQGMDALPATLRKISELSAANQRLFQTLAAKGEREELLPASRIDGSLR